jgi:hypothetical protein
MLILLDQAIRHHKNLIKIMNEFAEGLVVDLEKVKRNLTKHRHVTDSYFEGVKSHLGDLKTEVQSTMRAMSHEMTVCEH